MNKSLIIGIILGLIIVGGVYFLGSSAVTGNVVSDSKQDNTVEITLKASRFQYDPGTIHVKQGDHVKIMIDNLDTTHGIVIPSLGVSGINSVEFTADKAGTYDFHCPTVCGTGHKDMKGTLVVDAQ